MLLLLLLLLSLLLLLILLLLFSVELTVTFAKQRKANSLQYRVPLV